MPVRHWIELLDESFVAAASVSGTKVTQTRPDSAAIAGSAAWLNRSSPCGSAGSGSRSTRIDTGRTRDLAEIRTGSVRPVACRARLPTDRTNPRPTTPCTNTLCSYSAISEPSTCGVTCSTSSMLLGGCREGAVRDQSVDHLGAIPPACSSLRASASVRPRINAWACARQLATSCRGDLPADGDCAGQDEIGRDQPGTLVDQLEEAVLAHRCRVGPRPAPVGSRPGRHRGDPFAVALHVQLLQEGRKCRYWS